MSTGPRKQLEITFKVRNNLLKARRVELGLTAKRAAKLARVNYSTWSSYESLRISPVNRKTGAPRRSAESIARFFRCHFDDIWPAAVSEIERTEVRLLADIADLRPALSEGTQRLALPVGDRESYYDEQELRDTVAAVLAEFKPRTQAILRRYFGLDCPAETLEEIGASMHLMRERVWQIKEQALAQLRRGKFGHMLAPYA